MTGVVEVQGCTMLPDLIKFGFVLTIVDLETELFGLRLFLHLVSYNYFRSLLYDNTNKSIHFSVIRNKALFIDLLI